LQQRLPEFPLPAGYRLRGEKVTLTAADGHRLAAYSVRPQSELVAGLVILQEIFGVNQHIREVCESYASAGFTVVSPQLFDRVERDVELGYDFAGIERGRKLRASIDWADTLLDVQAAIDSVQQAGPVAIIGYCWGGTLAFLAATRLHGLCCAVAYYGGQTVPFAHEKPKVPVLLHFGEHDSRITAADRQAILRHHRDIEWHLFPADHGFNCNHRKEWDAQSARRALEITMNFVNRNLAKYRSPEPAASPR
jgi:carboxymethylenebutenolidase